MKSAMLLGAALALVLSGCGSEDPIGAERGVPAGNTVEMMLLPGSGPTVFATWTDWSKQIEVKTWMCGWVGPNFNNTGDCRVGEGYVMIGGGAEIYPRTEPGAILSGSMPVYDTRTWRARSQNVVTPQSHWLRVYVMGMRLRTTPTGSWISASSLANDIIIIKQTSCNTDGCYPVSTPSAEADLDPPDGEGGGGRSNLSDLRVGGGAWTVGTTGAGQLLTRSAPNGTTGWMAASKDHYYADPGFVETYAITIRRCPAGFKGVLESGTWDWNGFFSGTGYWNNGYDIPSKDWAATGVGAMDVWELGGGPGRMLTDLFPTLGGSVAHGGVTAWSKDQYFQDPTGNLHVFVSGLRKNRNTAAKCTDT